LRILFQYLASGYGGGLSNVALLLRAMADEFPLDELHIACTPASIPKDVSQNANIFVHVLGGRTPLELQRLWFESTSVRRMALQIGADIIWSLNVGPYIRTGIPQVLSLHNAFQVYPWGECARFHPGSAPILAGLRLFFRRSLRCSDAAIVQTPLMGKYVQGISGAPDRIAALPKSVEGLADLHQDPAPDVLTSNTRPGSFRFLYVATIAPHKNHSVIIEATRLLAERDPNVQLVLTLTPAEAEQVAGMVVHQMIARGNLLCIGWVTKSQLRSVYEACNACLMPSLLESLSSCHLEAMAWSKPQVVSDCPFARDTCGTAALFAPNTARAWADEMGRLMCSEALRTELVTRGQKRIAEFPATWRHAARHVRDFLASTVQQAATSNLRGPVYEGP
jgi:glycosyltransferase involved in cell wall biosynthesis